MNPAIKTRFDGYTDIENIRKRVTLHPDPVEGLEALQPRLAAEKFAEKIMEIYLPNEFSLQFIQEMINLANLHSFKTFSSAAGYSEKVFTPADTEVFPICLNGLAGVGKSQTIVALLRALPPPIEFACDLFQGTIDLTSYWYASARGKASGKQLLLDFVIGGEHDGRGGHLKKLLVQSRQIASRDGVSIVALDETQHINTGQGASKVTDILLTMAGIGPPMIYVSNFSLIHKLFRRNSEDKQRLLSEPRIMLPDTPESQDWHDYVKECMRVSGGRIKASTDEFAAELYRSTFGIKRLAMFLLKAAYIECRTAGRKQIEVDDLFRAYRSSGYTSNARDVEELQLQMINQGSKRARLDLVCPFDLPAEYKSNVVSFTRAERDKRVQARAFDSSTTPAERSVLNKILVPEEKATARKNRRSPVPKATDEDLVRAFHQYMDSQPGPQTPKKPR